MSAPWRVTNVCFNKLTIIRSISTGSPVCRQLSSSLHQTASSNHVTFLQIVNLQHTHVAKYAQGFFARTTGTQLWESVNSVSNAGRKKGRGRAVGRKKVADLNRGQKLGDGRITMQWPGLNAPVIRNRMVLKHQHITTGSNRQQELIELREKLNMIRYPATPPLLRGYSGGKLAGTRHGPPDPIADYTFDGFDSILIELKHVSNMTGTLGRKMHYTATMIVGNGHGIAGFGYGKAPRVGNAIKVAKNRAAQAMYYIPRFEDHTVYHDMFTQYHKSKIFIHKREKGYGLQCHRVLTSICKMIGITDLHCKVEGSTTNYKAIAKGFLEALVDQESHQELADRTGYHVIEQRKERDNFPQVVASPSNGIVRADTCKEDANNIEFDLNRMYLNGRVELIKKKGNPFKNKSSWHKQKHEKNKTRNQADLQLQRKAGLI